MSRSMFSLGVVLLLLAVGFVGITFVQNRSHSNAGANAALPASQASLDKSKEDNSVPSLPTALPTVLSGFPDIEHVPVYPGASFVSTKNEHPNPSIRFLQMVYEVDASIDSVAKFYEDMLTKKGWLFRGLRGQTFQFSWADPSTKSPWHLYLELNIGLTLDDTRTLVDLNYGRYPDIDEGLPLYPGGQQVEVTHSVGKEPILYTGEVVPVTITETTYLTSASPQEIADFYNTSMPGFGWFFYNESGPNPGKSSTQTGDITSKEGLYYKSGRAGWGTNTTLNDDLFITATVQKDGQTLVKLHVEEFEAPNYPGY